MQSATATMRSRVPVPLVADAAPQKEEKRQLPAPEVKEHNVQDILNLIRQGERFEFRRSSSKFRGSSFQDESSHLELRQIKNQATINLSITSFKNFEGVTFREMCELATPVSIDNTTLWHVMLRYMELIQKDVKKIYSLLKEQKSDRAKTELQLESLKLCSKFDNFFEGCDFESIKRLGNFFLMDLVVELMLEVPEYFNSLYEVMQPMGLQLPFLNDNYVRDFFQRYPKPLPVAQSAIHDVILTSEKFNRQKRLLINTMPLAKELNTRATVQEALAPLIVKEALAQVLVEAVAAQASHSPRMFSGPPAPAAAAASAVAEEGCWAALSSCCNFSNSR